MVCPLRFVLAGLSAAIVLFLAVDMLWLSSKDDVYQGLEVCNLYVVFSSSTVCVIPPAMLFAEHLRTLQIKSIAARFTCMKT